MRKLTHSWPQWGRFFSKLRQFFPIFETGQGRPTPPFLPSNSAPDQAEMPLVKYEDFPKLSIKQLVMQSRLVFLGYVWYVKNQCC